MSKRLKVTYTIVISIWLICIFIMWASNKYEDRKPEKLVEVYSENKEWKVTVVYDKPLLFQSEKNVHLVVNDRYHMFSTTVKSKNRKLTKDNYRLEVTNEFIRLELIDDGNKTGKVYCTYYEDFKDNLN